jgi:2-amino-4-hydroxy-6-hydroxymethyldihydropteridine diphosphokinase
MNGIYLVIGGNLGDREFYLHTGLSQIATQIGTVEKESSVYETASWGNTGLNPFLNQVVYVRSDLSARAVLETCLQIEQRMGRIREEKWGSRTIDIDLLFYNDEIIREEHLTIPHPYLQQRRFVLLPLHEIAPTYRHPVLNLTISELLENCADTLPVNFFAPATSKIN